MRSVVVKTLGLVASIVLLLTACGGAWSIFRGERLPGEVAARPEVQTPIERTIDNFTLGMAQEEALAQFAAGLQQHTLTVLSRTAMPLDRLEALQERWITHVPPRAFFTQGFTEGEFTDRHSNQEIAQKFAVSVAFKSQTTQSMTLNFYQAKLFKIDVVPLTQYAVVQQTFKGTYGLPNTPLPGVEEWRDRITLLRVLKPGRLLKDSILFYIDRLLYTRLRRDAGAIKRALEDEGHRRKSTLLQQG